MTAAPARLPRRRSASVQGHVPEGVTTLALGAGRAIPRRQSLPEGRPARPPSALSVDSSLMGRSTADTRNNFLVAVRVRPPLDRELSTRGVCRCVDTDREHGAITVRKPETRPRTLDVGDFGGRLHPAQASDLQSFAYDRLFGMT